MTAAAQSCLTLTEAFQPVFQSQAVCVCVRAPLLVFDSENVLLQKLIGKPEQQKKQRMHFLVDAQAEPWTRSPLPAPPCAGSQPLGADT